MSTNQPPFHQAFTHALRGGMVMKGLRAVSLPVSVQLSNVHSCSGVFVGGQNVIYGWSAHSKSNTGFGALASSNLVYRNLTVVYDPDACDTPVDDRDVHVFAQANRRPPLTYVGFQALNVNTMQQNSGVFVGEANISGWDQHQKSNRGTGDTFGHHNGSVQNVHVNFDPDVVDMPVADQDVKSSVFQRMV